MAALLIVYFLYHGNRLDLSFAGIGVVLGHSFPFWNHFKGGKGVAVTALWIVFFDWRAGLIALSIGLFLVDLAFVFVAGNINSNLRLLEL